MSSTGGIQRVYFQLWGSRKGFKDKVACILLFRFCRILTRDSREHSSWMKWVNRGSETRNQRARLRNNILVDPKWKYKQTVGEKAGDIES